MYSFLILSSLITPHIHISVLNFPTFVLCYVFLFTARHFDQCNIVSIIIALYNLPFNFIRTLVFFLHFICLYFILFFVSSTNPQFFCTIDPKYLNLQTLYITYVIFISLRVLLSQFHDYIHRNHSRLLLLPFKCFSQFFKTSVNFFVASTH